MELALDTFEVWKRLRKRKDYEVFPTEEERGGLLERLLRYYK